MAASLARRSRWVVGMATLTMKKSSTLMKTPVNTTGRSHRGGGVSPAGPLASRARVPARGVVVVVMIAPRDRTFGLLRLVDRTIGLPSTPTAPGPGRKLVEVAFRVPVGCGAGPSP